MDFSLNYGLDDPSNANVDPATQTEEVDLAFESGELMGGAFPDLTADNGSLTGTLNALEDLNYLYEDMSKAGGMCQTFALEAQRLLPEFDGRQHIGFYTKTPSATRYKVALEEMHKGIIALIVAGVGAILVMIYKALRWMFGKKGDSADKAGGKGEGKKDAKAVEEKVAETKEYMETAGDKLNHIAEVSKDLSNEVRKGVSIKDKNGREHQFFSLETLVEAVLEDASQADEVNEFMTSKNPLFHDIVENGPYTKVMITLSRKLKTEILPLVSKYNEDLQNILDKDLSSLKSAELVNNAALNDKPAQVVDTEKGKVEVGGGPKLGDELQFEFEGSKRTIRGISTFIGDKRRALEGTKPNKRMKFEQVFYSMEKAYREGPLNELLDSFSESAQILDKAAEDLEALRQRAGSIQTDGSDGSPTPAIAATIRSIIERKQQEVMELMSVNIEIERYRMVLLSVGTRAVGFSQKFATKLGRDLTGADEDAIALAKQLAKAASEYREDFRKFHVTV